MSTLFRATLKGYCRRIPKDGVSTNTVWYLPHHAVINPHKPGKVGVVFDCAAKWQGVSLRDVLLRGPDLANSFVGVLTRFRMHPVVVVADVQEMFHQVASAAKWLRCSTVCILARWRIHERS